MTVLVGAPNRPPMRGTRPSLIRLVEGADGTLYIESPPDEGEADWFHCQLSLTAAGFRQMGDALLNAWQTVIGVTNASTPLQLTFDQPENDAAQQRVRFASAGNFAFRSLLDDLSGDMKAIFEMAVRELLSTSHELVFMSSIPFPWRMLYAHPDGLNVVIDDDDDEEDVPVNGFLGYAGIVDHQYPRTKRPGRALGSTVPISIHQQFASGPGNLDAVKAAVQPLRWLKPEQVSSAAELTRALVRDSSPLVYVFCHGQFDTAAGGRSVQRLHINQGQSILEASELVRRFTNRLPDGQFQTAPMVLINACQAGSMTLADEPDTVVDTLHKHGALATLSPLVDMPIVFGARYGVSVLAALAEGTSLAEAALAATRHAADESLNLLGLTYSTVNARNARLQEGIPI